MNTKKTSLLVVLVISLCLITASAKAAIIPISSAETIFNFDFTALDPSPPYTNIMFSAIFDKSNPISVGVDSMLTKVYGGLNGTELLQIRNDTLPGFSFDVSFNDDGTFYGPLTTANPLYNPMLDGTFSFGLQMNSGTANLVSFTACGVTSGVVGPCVSHPVPLPATGILLATGLLGFSLVKDRRSANSLRTKRGKSIEP